MLVRVGPVDAASARAWLDAAQGTIDLLRDGGGPEVPDEIVELFQGYVSTWRAHLAGPVFDWSAEVDPAEVRRVGLHWARIATATRAGYAGLATAPPEAAAFYDAVAAAIATVLAADTSDDLDHRVVSEAFPSVVPGFDERLSSSASDGATEASPPTRVLIVDDDPDIRLLLSIALEREEDLEVVGEAADGRAAIDAVAQTDVDVVLLDLHMPHMDGLTALPHVRAARPHAAVIVFSASGMADEALGAGADEFVDKATPLSRLAGKIRSVAAGTQR